MFVLCIMYVCMYVLMYVCMCTCICVYACKYISSIAGYRCKQGCCEPSHIQVCLGHATVTVIFTQPFLSKNVRILRFIIVYNSKFLQRNQRRSLRSQRIQKHENRSKGRGIKIQRARQAGTQAGNQTVRRLWWVVFGVESVRQVGEDRLDQDSIGERALFYCFE